MRKSLKKDLKIFALAFALTFALIAVPSLLGGTDARLLSLLVSTAIAMAAFFIVAAVPAVLWGWTFGAGLTLAMGLSLVLVGLVAVTGLSSIRAESLWAPVFALIAGPTLLVLAWLMRKSRDAADWVRESPTPARSESPPWNPPSWMPSSLHIVYRTSSGHRVRYEIRQQDGGWIIRCRDEELEAMDREWRTKNPESGESVPLKEVDPWREFPMGDWAQTDFEPLLDLSRPWESQPLNHERITEMGQESATFQGTSYSCRKVRIAWTTDCVCVEMAPRHMFYIGPGRCSICAGLFSRLRRCSKCKGSGRCNDCPGTGKNARETTYWFEERRGILLRTRHTSNGTLKAEQDLETLEPDVLARW